MWSRTITGSLGSKVGSIRQGSLAVWDRSFGRKNARRGVWVDQRASWWWERWRTSSESRARLPSVVLGERRGLKVE